MKQHLKIISTAHHFRVLENGSDEHGTADVPGKLPLRHLSLQCHLSPYHDCEILQLQYMYKEAVSEY